MQSQAVSCTVQMYQAPGAPNSPDMFLMIHLLNETNSVVYAVRRASNTI